MRPLVIALGAIVLGVAALACAGRYVRPTTSERVRSTPERIARGSYLVNHVMSCGVCHTPREGGSIAGGERAERFLAGGVVERPRGRRLAAPNLTPDVETGLGAWSDDELLRAIRDGVARDGRLLAPAMPFRSYRYLADEDARSVVAYLRSVPPLVSERPPHAGGAGVVADAVAVVADAVVASGALHHAAAHDVSAPDGADRLRYGEYLGRLGHCWECHSATASGPREDDEEGAMAGWSEPQEYAGVGVVYFRNLTPDGETGLGRRGAAEIAHALRRGARLDGRPMAAPMRAFIPHLAGLTDDDLDALVAYLRSVQPYANRIPERALDPDYERALSGH